MIQADSAALQPQVDRDEHGFFSCGVRGVVLTEIKDYLDAYDFSLMVRADMMYGLLKAGKLKASMKAVHDGNYTTNAVVPPPIKFWIAQESEGKAIGLKKVMPADNKGFILEIADFVDTHRLIMAMIHGERMQFAVRYKSQPVDVVVSFAAEMPELERAPLLKCLDGVIERISKKGEQAKN